jgi:hypothetical protein
VKATTAVPVYGGVGRDKLLRCNKIVGRLPNTA